MSIKPILFNTDMVRAIQANKKTVTRRLLKLDLRENECSTIIVSDKDTGEFCYVEVLDEWENEVRRIYSPYSPGDILWVREAWGIIGEMNADEMESGDCMFVYKADPFILNPRWRPSIHMPKKAARIFLRVKSVREESLQDIDFKGVVAEGVDPMDIIPWVPAHPDYPGVDMDAIVGREQEHEMRKLINLHFGKEIWDKTIKAADLPIYGWDANPPVLVNEFERCDPPEGWYD